MPCRNYKSDTFICSNCNNLFQTGFWFDTQKTDKKGNVTKRRQVGCPKCHRSVSKAVV